MFTVSDDNNKNTRYLKDLTNFKKRFEKISNLNFSIFVNSVLDREISLLENEVSN